MKKTHFVYLITLTALLFGCLQEKGCNEYAFGEEWIEDCNECHCTDIGTAGTQRDCSIEESALWGITNVFFDGDKAIVRVSLRGAIENCSFKVKADKAIIFNDNVECKQEYSFDLNQIGYENKTTCMNNRCKQEYVEYNTTNAIDYEFLFESSEGKSVFIALK